MAAHGNFIRVRLYFDYPPPAVVDCRMCWLLVDLNKCRVVADLESIIREKFEFSRGNILNLFVEDCYLPHTESIYVVRDNDSVRVKVDCLTPVNGHSSCPDASNQTCRKRHRPTEDDGPGENGVNVEWKKKKRKRRSEEGAAGVAKQTSGDEKKKKSLENKTEKKKKKKKKAKENGRTATPKPAKIPTKNTPVSVEKPVKSTKKTPVAQAKTQNSSSSDSSSEEDEAPKKTATKTPTPTPAAPKPPPNTKPALKKKLNPPSSSSSETDSSSDEDTSVKIPTKAKPLSSTTPKPSGSGNANSQQTTNCAEKPVAATHNKIAEQPEPCNTNEEEEIELVIRRPVQQLGRGLGFQSSWRGHGRGRAVPGGGGGGDPGGRGRSNGRGTRQPSYQTDSLTNVSMVIQNEAETAPKRDYSSMPLLAAAPQVGQKIAFKLLELTENFRPEVSEYKEAEILSFDPTSKQIELKLFNASRAPAEPGKFDLVYQNPDGSETVEYAVSRESCVTERWDLLLEPRLII